jgi:cytochrome c5
MERPYVPFYKPYGMTDEEYEYEVKIAEQRLAEWGAENEALQQADVIKSVCDVCGSGNIIEAPHMGKNCNRCHPL